MMLWWFWVYLGLLATFIATLIVLTYRINKIEKRRAKIREWRTNKLERAFNRIYASVLEIIGQLCYSTSIFYWS